MLFNTSNHILTVPALVKPANMVSFFDLPFELREMVYGYAFRGARLRFMAPPPALRHPPNELSSTATFLICSKRLHAEARPIFDRQVRLEISEAIRGQELSLDGRPYRRPGTTVARSVIPPRSLAALRNVKIHAERLRWLGTLQMIKSMANLEELSV